MGWEAGAWMRPIGVFGKGRGKGMGRCVGTAGLRVGGFFAWGAEGIPHTTADDGGRFDKTKQLFGFLVFAYYFFNVLRLSILYIT